MYHMVQTPHGYDCSLMHATMEMAPHNIPTNRIPQQSAVHVADNRTEKKHLEKTRTACTAQRAESTTCTLTLS
jgi:hypothetical protein